MRLGLGLSFGRPRSSTGGGGALGPEVWPQPLFDASAGLTLTNATIGGGELAFNAEELGSQICAMTTPPAFAQGEVWVYSVGVLSNPTGAGLVFLRIGGQAVDLYSAGGAGLRTGQVTLGVAPTAELRFLENSGFVGFGATSCSVKKQG